MERENQARHCWREPEFFCLMVVVVVGFFYRLEALSVRGEEPRRTAIGLEMMQTGEWLVPRLQGEPVFFRPPLQNWLLALSTWLHGTCDAWAVRLPGALAILATALFLYLYCRNFLSPLGAFTSAAAFATMLQVMELGRLAETESLFTALVSGSLLIWHWGYWRQWPDKRTWITAYFMAGLGMLAKGSQAPIYLAASTGMFLICTRQWRRLFSLAHLAGLGTFALVFGAWYVPYCLKMGLDAGWKIFVGDTSKHLFFDTGFFQHLWQFPLETLACMLPWSFLLTAYASRSLRRSLGAARPMVGFLLICLVMTFPSCWLVRGGLTRYWMPLYPCVAPLIGLVVARCAEAAAESRLRKRWTLCVTVAGLIMAGAAFFALATLWPALPRSPLCQPRGYALAFALAAACLACFALAWRGAGTRPKTFIPVLALAIFPAMTNSVWVMNYQMARSVDINQEMTRLKEVVPAGELVYFGSVDHRFAFYFGQPLPSLPWPDRESDVPNQVTYFCFNLDAGKKDVPFAWEKVAEVVCDRFVSPHPEAVTIVGRRLNPNAAPALRTHRRISANTRVSIVSARE